jgi:quercetin dioxygenase-like cupin family protein
VGLYPRGGELGYEHHLTVEDGMSQSDAPNVSQPGEGEIIRIPLGRDIVIEATGRETGGAYSMMEFTAPVGGEWTIPHVHRAAEEGWYVLEGELPYCLGDRTVRAPAGRFVLVPRGMLHSFGNTALLATWDGALFR